MNDVFFNTNSGLWLFASLGIYLVLLLAILFYVLARKEANSAEKIAVGARNYGLWIIFPSLIVTMIGPGYTLGAASRAATNGYLYMGFYCVAMVQVLLFGLIFAKPFFELSRNKRTVGDIVGAGYGINARRFTGIATLLQAIAFSGLFATAAAKTLGAIFGLPFEPTIVIVTLVVAMYTMTGGLPAVLRTDILQFLLLIGVLFLGYVAILRYGNSWVVSDDWAWNTTSPLTLEAAVTLCVAFFFGEAFLPAYAVRSMIGKTADVAAKAFTAAAVMGVVWFLSVGLFGVFAASLSQNNPANEAEFFLRFLTAGLVEGGVASQTVGGIFMLAILGIVMSSFDSVMHTGAISFTRDVIGSFWKVNNDKEYTVGRIMVLVIGTAGVFVTLITDDIMDLLLFGFTIWAPTMAIPIGYLVLKKGQVRNRASGAIGIASGTIGFFLFDALGFSMLPGLLGGILSSAIGVFLTEWFGGEDQRSHAT